MAFEPANLPLDRTAVIAEGLIAAAGQRQRYAHYESMVKTSFLTLIVLFSAFNAWAGKYKVGMSARALQSSDLEGLSMADLYLLRNEIFARHGYKFKKSFLKEFFDLNFQDLGKDQSASLNDLDKKNLEAVERAEKIARKNAEEKAAKVSAGFKFDAKIDDSQERCFRTSLVDGQADQTICLAFEPAAEFRMALISINGDFKGLPADFRVETLKIVDIDKADRFREVAIAGLGSQTIFTWLLGYQNGGLVDFGNFPPRTDTNENSILDTDGRNHFYALVSSNFLESWGWIQQYHFNGKHLVEAAGGDLHDLGTGVRLKVHLAIQKSRTDSSIVATLVPGEEATLVSSDNKTWCLIRTKKGAEGWFAVDPGNVIRGTGKAADDVFEGLQHAG